MQKKYEYFLYQRVQSGIHVFACDGRVCVRDACVCACVCAQTSLKTTHEYVNFFNFLGLTIDKLAFNMVKSHYKHVK